MFCLSAHWKIVYITGTEFLATGILMQWSTCKTEKRWVNFILQIVEFKRNVKAKWSKVRSRIRSLNHRKSWIWSKLMFRRLLNHAKLPNCLWGEALITANYLQNRIISSCVPNTPFEMWENKKTYISNLQIFCSTTYALIPKEKLKKLDNRSQKLVFIGFDEN